MPHPRLSRVLPTESWSWTERLLVAGLSATLALSVWWSRIRLGHHTKAQVIAGGALGSACAVVAFLLWHGSLWLEDIPHVHLKGIPATGLQERGLVLERAVEDLAFVALDAWEQQRPTLLLQGLQKAV